MPDIIDLLEKFNVRKVEATIDPRTTPGGINYEMFVMHVTINGKKSTWQLGLKKLRDFMNELPFLIKEVEAFDFTKGTWTKLFEFTQGNNPQFKTEPLKISQNHVFTLYLFQEDIKKFIAERTKIFRAPAIKEVSTYDWVHDLDVTPMIALPCYPMQPGDTGEGLVPWQLSAKTVSNMLKYYIFRDEGDGNSNEGWFGKKGEEYDIDTWFELWSEAKPDEPCVYKGTKQDGTPYEKVFSPEQVRAWIKYGKELAKFDRKNR